MYQKPCLQSYPQTQRRIKPQNPDSTLQCVPPSLTARLPAAGARVTKHLRPTQLDWAPGRTRAGPECASARARPVAGWLPSPGTHPAALKFDPGPPTLGRGRKRRGRVPALPRPRAGAGAASGGIIPRAAPSLAPRLPQPPRGTAGCGSAAAPPTPVEPGAPGAVRTPASLARDHELGPHGLQLAARVAATRRALGRT